MCSPEARPEELRNSQEPSSDAFDRRTLPLAAPMCTLPPWMASPVTYPLAAVARTLPCRFAVSMEPDALSHSTLVRRGTTIL